MVKENVVKLKDEDLESVCGGGGFWGALAKMSGTNESDVVEGAGKELGKTVVVAATAIVALPIVTGVSTLAKWGFDRLTKMMDQKLDAKKIK